MENKKKFFFFWIGNFFFWNWEKKNLFGIGNGAEFRPQNRVIESPAESLINQFLYMIKVVTIIPPQQNNFGKLRN